MKEQIRAKEKLILEAKAFLNNKIEEHKSQDEER